MSESQCRFRNLKTRTHARLNPGPCWIRRHGICGSRDQGIQGDRPGHLWPTVNGVFKWQHCLSQARYAAALVKGDFRLPPKEKMLEDWKRQVESIRSKGRPLSDLHVLAEEEVRIILHNLSWCKYLIKNFRTTLEGVEILFFLHTFF